MPEHANVSDATIAARRRDAARPAGSRHPVLAAGLLLLLAWAPLPLASNRPWAWSLLTVLGALLLLGWAVGEWRRPRLRIARLPMLGLALIGVAMLWAVLQQVPWMPASWHHPLWQVAVDYGLAVQPSIGIDPFGGHEALLRFAGYAAVFWVAFAIGQDAATARRLVHGVIVIVTAYAAYGVLMRLSGTEAILWFDKQAYVGSVTSTFVNRNNFATYANLGIVSAMALVLGKLLRETTAGWRRQVYDQLNELFSKRVPLLLATSIIATASLLSLSRGGLLGLAAGVLVMIGAVLMFGRSRIGLALVALAVLAAVGGVLVYVSAEGTLIRLGDISSDVTLDGQGRFAAWSVCLAMIAERPWLGHGYGAFEAAFMARSPEQITTIFDKAHNTFLEHMVVLGLPAAALLYAGFACLIGACLRGLRERRRDREFTLLAISASVVVGAHALVDFSLQIPAVAVTYATLLAVGVAQAMRSEAAQASAARSGGLPRLAIRARERELSGAAAE